MEIMAVLDKPLTKEELAAAVDEKGWLERTVKVELADVVNTDYDGFIALLSELMIGNDGLVDVTYSMAGCYYEFILVRVCGTVQE